MISLKNKESCCGCYSCVQKCHNKAILIVEDEEGFDYPVVDKSLCIDCGTCEQVCPQLHESPARNPLECYAAKHQSKQDQLRSSSGGVFSLFAEYVLDNKGGVVFGAAFDREWNIVCKYIEKKEELDDLRRSKYVQSKIGNAYKDAQTFLKEGRLVLFVGTPCQIHGLKLFLRKEYDNLVTVDFVCHGVPSQKVWQGYIKDVLKKQGKAWAMRSIEFRNKRLGWLTFSFAVNFTRKDSRSSPKTSCLHETFRENPYLRGFIHDLFLRPSCYTCRDKSFKSGSDFTIADFWGIRETYPRFYDKDGVSCLTVNTSHAKDLFAEMHIQCEEVAFDNVLRYNPSFTCSVKRPPFRNCFFKLMGKVPFKPLVLFGCAIDKLLRVLKVY